MTNTNNVDDPVAVLAVPVEQDIAHMEAILQAGYDEVKEEYELDDEPSEWAERRGSLCQELLAQLRQERVDNALPDDHDCRLEVRKAQRKCRAAIHHETNLQIEYSCPKCDNSVWVVYEPLKVQVKLDNGDTYGNFPNVGEDDIWEADLRGPL